MKQVLIATAVLLLAGAAYALSPPAATPQTTDDDSITEITAGPPAALKKCTGCHGKQLEGKKKAKKIAGMAAKKILAAVGHGIAKDDVAKNIKPDGKIPKVMKGVAKKLSDADKKAIADFVSKCPPAGCP